LCPLYLYRKKVYWANYKKLLTDDERLIRQDTSRRGLSGEKNGRAKLDWNKVNQIRKLHSSKQYKNLQISEMFGIKITTLEKIVANKLWTV
jgi:hypothetical protein